MEIANLRSLIIKGDKQAANILFAKVHKQAINIAMHVSGNYALAEDAAQETLLRAYINSRQFLGSKEHSNAGQFKGNSSFLTWTHLIAKRSAINIARSEKSLYQAQKEFINKFDAEYAPNPQDALLRSEQMMIVDKNIEGLSFKSRQCLYLRARGEEYNAIAKIENLQGNTARSIVFRGRSELSDDSDEQSDMLNKQGRSRKLTAGLKKAV